MKTLCEWARGGNSLVLDYYPLTDTTFICMSNRDPPVCDRLAFNAVFRAPRAPKQIPSHIKRTEVTRGHGHCNQQTPNHIR